MDFPSIFLVCGTTAILGRYNRFALAQSFDIVPHEPHPQQQPSSTEEEISPSMWPYPTYRPITWDRYYSNDVHEKHISLTSGLAAGITIGVFFAVFLLTFGCRLYNQRSESSRRLSSRSITHSSRNFCQRRLSVNNFFGCNSIPPPPTYDVAIRMPSSQGEPPPFTSIPQPNEFPTQGCARPA